MIAKLRSWWQYIREHWIVAIIIALVIAAMVLILVESLINGTGFNGYNQVTTAHTISGPSAGTVVRTEVSQPGKTLWDWMQLLIIPVALAIIAIFFNRAERKNEQRIASDNQQEGALQEYIKEMSGLLLERNLRTSDKDAEVRIIARVRTLTVLPRLDGKRKRNLLLFLYDAGLINKGDNIINMSEADLSEADLSEVSLCRPRRIRDSSRKREAITNVSADLSGVNLRNANLNGAILSDVKLGAEGNEFMIDLTLEISDQGSLSVGWIRSKLNDAKLVKANLFRADMGGVDLRGADLSGAFLGGANLQRADLSGANLHGANLSADTLVDNIFDPAENTPDLSGWKGADLSGADLSGANLSETNLWQANLNGAILRGVDLSGANLTEAIGTTPEQLSKALSLKDATMPDGSKHA